jgi:hypothetical protein
MTTVTIKETQNPTILKFEFEDFITQNEVTIQKHWRRQKSSSCTEIISPTFVKRFISPVILSLLKIYSIVEWDCKDAVAEQIDTFVNNGGHNWSRRKQDKNNL